MSHENPKYAVDRSALLTVNQVGLLLGISRPTVYRLARKGDLTSYRVGERLRFRLAEIEDYVERNRQPAASESASPALGGAKGSRGDNREQVTA